MKDMEKEIYFTPKQAAAYFNLSLSAVKNYIYGGKLKTLKTPGGHHRIRKSELLVTLGDRIVMKAGRQTFSLETDLCSAILGMFNALGPAGNSLIVHARNVSGLSRDIAKAIGMREPEVRLVEMAGLVHDIGHIIIERRVLLKQGLLSSQEYESVKLHPETGEKILDSIKGLEDVAVIVAQHHERLDGTGYPKGLREKDIQKAARIISVAEAYDSMVSRHSYKSPVSRDMAVFELMRQRDSQFDNEVLEALIKGI